MVGGGRGWRIARGPAEGCFGCRKLRPVSTTETGRIQRVREMSADFAALLKSLHFDNLPFIAKSAGVLVKMIDEHDVAAHVASL